MGGVTNKPAETYLAKLLIAWERAAAGANTLRGQFIAEMSAADSLVASGSISSVGKNSTNQSYKGYGPGSDTQEEIRGIWASLIALYDLLQAKITCEFKASADFDYAVPADFDFDAPILEILTKDFSSQVAGGTSTLPDISSLRLPPGTILGPGIRTW